MDDEQARRLTVLVFDDGASTQRRGFRAHLAAVRLGMAAGALLC
jgi:hypothetical protein